MSTPGRCLPRGGWLFLEKAIGGAQRQALHLSDDAVQLTASGNPSGEKVSLLAREENGHGLAMDLTSPLVVGTMESGRRGLAGATGLAANREAFHQAAAAEVADADECALEFLVALLKIDIGGHDLTESLLQL